MGWNGGGFGHMTFEAPSGVAAWHAASVSHDQWNDWADWFERPIAPKFIVGEQLRQLRELHDPQGHGYFVLDERDATVDFAFDTGEDTVRDFSGTIAATLRAAAEHGARGTFYFLGTAGAEYDFVYKLELANGLSTMETLGEREIAMVYESEAYQAFTARVLEALGISPDGELLGDAPAAPVADPERAALRQKAAAFTASLGGKPAAAPDQPGDAAEVATTAKQPATKQPAAKKAIAKQPAAKQPAAKTPAAKTATAKQPAAKTATAKQPAAKKATAKQPAAKQATAKQPAAKQPAVKQPAAKQPAAKQPAAKKPAAKKATAKKPAAKKPAAKKPAAKKR